LKGAANGLESAPRATYWLEGLDGKGGYVRSNLLPGEGAKPVSWFLGSGRSGTARSVNDGLLGRAPAGAGADRFTVNYDLPDPEYFAFWAQPMDANGLSYTTPALTAPMKLVGFPVARLSVSADKTDANVFVYLDQVDASGKAEV
ncbi:MAG: CocE/NonD family hydrolase C-terminal non-catalytic domain-containing protein, partial [Novosphingobium sp.]